MSVSEPRNKIFPSKQGVDFIGAALGRIFFEAAEILPQHHNATPWEAELDRLVRAQAQPMYPNKRTQYFDKVQEIVYEQAPFIYLVNKNAMSAYSTSLTGVQPATLRPQTFWNIEMIGKR